MLMQNGCCCGITCGATKAYPQASAQLESDFYYALSQRLFGVTVKYKVPAGSVTKTDKQLIQGWSMEMTPEETTFTLFTSPLTFYNFFTLDSATLGVLDTSRLAW